MIRRMFHRRELVGAVVVALLLGAVGGFLISPIWFLKLWP